MTVNKEPEISVGIVSGSGLTFTLNGDFIAADTGRRYTGIYTALAGSDGITIRNEAGTVRAGDEITFSPSSPDTGSFTLHAVTIGVDFHWQRNEDQTFRGNLKFIMRGDRLTAVNILPVEEYLASVISSEMSATSSGELLRAHAVISRSWLLAQIDKTLRLSDTGEKYRTSFVTDSEITRWYDREDHRDFDVCADDHCQRYQGITRASTREVEVAVRETAGEVLMQGDFICDARYSKCCGGATELFENCWEPVSHPYLRKILDAPAGAHIPDTDLSEEANAIEWINTSPEAFCNTSDKNILSQVLNNYDQETNDFFRWKVTYSQDELSDLVRERTGIDFGRITSLEPLTRGTSGRLSRLRITGDKKSLVIGKELEIRKALSKSHLYSSAFRVEKIEGHDGTLFVLHGAGWGHGVGLCQIGAAVMGAAGYTYRQIISHYFVGAEIRQLY
ncbi:MAG: SpoIID/LytB domain-containing protein [Bacteroidales bacterium]